MVQNNVIIGDSYNLNSLTDIFLVKIDEYGDTLWTKTYGGNFEDYGRSIQETYDGGFIVTGYIDPNTTTPNQDLILIKTNSYGDSLWTKIINEPGNCNWGHSVKQTSDNGYIIIGDTRPVVSSNGSFNGPLKMLVIKTDSTGDIEWEKKFGGGLSSERGLSGQETNDGGYIIGGYTSLSGNDMLIIKTNEQGDSLWSNTFGGGSDEVCASIQQTDDNGYILAGYTTTFGSGQLDVYLVKTDSVGNLLWNRTFGTLGSDRGYSVQQTTDGGYIITGFTSYIPGSTSSGYKDVWLIKTNGNGEITSTFEIPLPNSNRKLKKTIDILGKETKPQPNTPIIEIYDDGSVEKKVIVDQLPTFFGQF